MKIHVLHDDRLDFGGDNVTYLLIGGTYEVEPHPEVTRVIAAGNAIEIRDEKAAPATVDEFGKAPVYDSKVVDPPAPDATAVTATTKIPLESDPTAPVAPIADNGKKSK